MKTATYTSGVTAGVYGSAANSAVLTVKEDGVVTAASTIPISLPSIANQTVLVSTQTPQLRTVGTFMTFPIVNWDPSGMFNGTDAITIPATGIYLLCAGTTTPTFAGPPGERINVNSGATLIGYMYMSNANLTGSVMMPWRFNAGDVLRQECFIAHNISNQANSNYMGVTRIA